jgi:peptide/nickel transport system permease protein
MATVQSKGMSLWLARRIGASCLLLVFTSIVIFVVLRVIPGDPTSVKLGLPGVTQEQVQQLRHELGVDRPIVVQYIEWLGGAVRGDFGRSYFSDFPTSTLIGRAIGPTLELAVAAMLIVLLLAVPASIVMVVKPRSLTSRILSAYASGSMALPAFWLGLMLITVFSIRLGWLPSRGHAPLISSPLENLKHLILPAVTLAIVVSGPVIRFLYASLQEELSADYVRTAQGKGLVWRDVAVYHALPNGLLPTLNFVGIMTGSLLGGVVIVEWVFGWPGLGALAVNSVSVRDYSVLQGVVLLASAAFIFVTLVVDVLTFFIDPRLRSRLGAS